MDFATATPAEIDAAWNDAYVARDKAIWKAQHLVITYDEAEAEGFRGNRSSTPVAQAVRKMSVTEIVNRLTARAVKHEDKAADESLPTYTRAKSEDIAKRANDAVAAIESAEATLAAADAEWKARGGWFRAYLVVSSNKGHVHVYGCGSWRWTTQVSIVTELSGTDEAAVVAAHGTQACSRCFASAPVADGPPADGKCRPEFNVERTNHPMSMSPRGKCLDCGAYISLTSTGKGRAHKPKEA